MTQIEMNIWTAVFASRFDRMYDCLRTKEALGEISKGCAEVADLAMEGYKKLQDKPRSS